VVNSLTPFLPSFLSFFPLVLTTYPVMCVGAVHSARACSGWYSRSMQSLLEMEDGDVQSMVSVGVDTVERLMHEANVSGRRPQSAPSHTHTPASLTGLTASLNRIDTPPSLRSSRV
jgi:hypothetical protein